MVRSFRRRHRPVAPYILAAALLLLAAGGILYWVLRGPSPSPLGSPAPVASPSPSPASPSPAPSASPARSTPSPRPIQALGAAGLERSLYQASLTIGEEEASGALSLTYVNNGLETLYVLYFHLYPNTQGADSLVIQSVSLNGTAAYHTYTEDGTILCVPLLNELHTGDAARIYLEFTVQVPAGGYGPPAAQEEETPLWGLMPSAALYENGWVLEAAPEDVRFGPVADWRVDITSQRTPALASGTVEPLSEGRWLCSLTAATPGLYLLP